jgi:D-proline reductase (dithiol) PrdB
VTEKVDSYRFLDFFTRKLVRAWIDAEPQREIPWTPLSRPLAESRLTLISSGGMRLAGDRPFDQEGERRNPWWGDPTWRAIPRDATERDLRFDHLHVDNSHVERDLDCALPLRRLRELEAAGEVGRSVPTHYSFMGYILDPRRLLEESTPQMIERMRAEQVDVALLVPY